jgi:phage terminase large subunit-like protein
MQNPTAEEGALIKRDWWQIWEEDDPPECEFIIMSLDAAQEANNRADYNALTTWGVFFNEEVNNYNIILLNSIKKRMEFPELKQLVFEEYREWEPDAFIVEKKSNGAALYQELTSEWVCLLVNLLPVRGKTRFQESTQSQIYLPLGWYGHPTNGGQRT